MCVTIYGNAISDVLFFVIKELIKIEKTYIQLKKYKMKFISFTGSSYEDNL